MARDNCEQRPYPPRQMISALILTSPKGDDRSWRSRAATPPNWGAIYIFAPRGMALGTIRTERASNNQRAADEAVLHRAESVVKRG
jgi:hypothetical protein